MEYFFHPKNGCIDEVFYQGSMPVSAMTNKTLPELEREYGSGILILKSDSAWERHHDRYREAPQRVTRSHYLAALERLPPEDWEQRPGQESFKWSERISGEITRIHCRIGRNHFTLCDDATLSHEQIVQRCQDSTEQTPVLVVTTVESGSPTVTRFDSLRAAEQATQDFYDYVGQQCLEGTALIVEHHQISQSPNLTDNVQNADANIALLLYQGYTRSQGRWNAGERTIQALEGRKCTDLSLPEALRCNLFEFAP